MFSILMGGLSAISLGVADFLASQSSERIGAPRAVAGMLFVSTLVLTLYLLVGEGVFDVMNTYYASGILFGVIHGVAFAFALALFFHAMAIGRISYVAPIVAAHPVFIVIFALVSGTAPSSTQLAAVAAILVGVGLVSATGRSSSHAHVRECMTAPVRQVVAISLAASLLYAGAIIAVQQAVQRVPELPLLWLGRTSGLMAIITVVLIQGKNPLPPSRNWWLFFLFHGFLDSAGLLFILFGSTGGPENAITAVVASTFPIVTVLLAWTILKERMTLLQTISAGKIFAGVALLAALGDA